jgi:hypothetical protein
VVEVPQVLDKVIAAGEALFSDAIAAWNSAGIFWGSHAMDGGLVALEVGKAGEVCGRGAGWDFARPCSGDRC